jgi:hypothetical protein
MTVPAELDRDLYQMWLTRDPVQAERLHAWAKDRSGAQRIHSLSRDGGLVTIWAYSEPLRWDSKTQQAAITSTDVEEAVDPPPAWPDFAVRRP